MNEVNKILEELLSLSDKPEHPEPSIGIKQKELTQKLSDVSLNSKDADELSKAMFAAVLENFAN